MEAEAKRYNKEANPQNEKYKNVREMSEGEAEEKEEQIRKSEQLVGSNDMLTIQSKTDWDGLSRFNNPIIVDFFKGKSKRIYPKMMNKAKGSQGKVILAGVNIEEKNAKEIVKRMNIRDQPTVVLMHKGRIVDQMVGDDESHFNKLFERANELK